MTPPPVVLVVEDQPDAGELLVRLLRRLGFAAALVTDGAAALAFVRRAPTALVILDVMMPGGIDGFAVLRAIRANPATAELPVVMYSAGTDAAARRQAVQLGAQDYLVKGATNLDQLAAVIRRYAGGTIAPFAAAA